MTGSTRKEPFGFVVIGLCKVASGIMLLGLGFGIFRMLDRNLGESLEHVVSQLHLDANNHFIHTLIMSVSGLDRAHLKAIGAGTFAYAGLHFLEGTGLILRKRWAGYLTIIITGSLLPVEAYEIWRKPTAVRILVLLVNLGFVAYIVFKFRQESRAIAAEKREADVISSE